MTGNTSALSTLTPQERVRLQRTKERALPPAIQDARIIELKKLADGTKRLLLLARNNAYWLADLSKGKVRGLETVP